MSNKHIYIAAFCCCIASGMYAQGVVNNGATIVITNTSNIYINGTTGHYTSQNGGVVTNSSTGGTIRLSGNWSNNSSNTAFSNDGSTVMLIGANQSIGGTSSSSFYNLTLAGTGTKTLNINTTAGGISTLTGVLSLGTRPLVLNGNTLTITNPAATAITYSSGYIESETNAAFNNSIIQWNIGTSTGAHVYPFGVGGTQIPFTFNKTTAGAASISVSTRSTTGSNNTPWPNASNVAAVSHMYDPTLGQDGSDEAVIDRWWDITASAAVTGNLTFSYRGSENTMIPGYQTGSLGAQHWDGTAWEPPVGSGTGVTAGVGTVTVTGASTFSPWVISSSLAPLPIELVYFEAKCENNEALLKWTTATETNNDHFTIERSYDGTAFEVIAIVDGAGNSTSLIDYSYTDKNFLANRAYYRLKQTDFDGKHSYSEIVSTEGCSEKEEWMYAVMSEIGLDVYFSSPAEQQFTIALYDVAGRIITSRPVIAEKGTNRITVPGKNFSNGIYMLTLQSPSKTLTAKVPVHR